MGVETTAVDSSIRQASNDELAKQRTLIMGGDVMAALETVVGEVLRRGTLS